MSLTILLVFVAIALVSEYINGFHDTANSIATVVATKVLSPGQAVLLAAATNLAGALAGTAVAQTIAVGLINTNLVEITAGVLICALVAGIVWNLVTWWVGLPSSSSHALIGGLIGAAIGAAHGNFNVLIWSKPADPWYKGAGLLWKIVIPMVTSPIAGFFLAMAIMSVLFAIISSMNGRSGWLGRISRPRWVNALFGKAQLGSAAYMGFAHGLNDAQKTMGIIALAFATATAAGQLHDLPGWLQFVRIEEDANGKFGIPIWIKFMCAIVMAAGTAAGGWRIIKTLGHKMVKLHPIDGFAAEMSSATILSVAASMGMPISTTHSISTAIMGVGVVKNPRALRWPVVERIIWAWVLTLPATGGLAYLLVSALVALDLVR